MEFGIVGPTGNADPGQSEVAQDWQLSPFWEPQARVTATTWRHSLESQRARKLFGFVSCINWADVGPREITGAMVEYARLGLATVVPPCLEEPRTRAKRFRAALRRVVRQAGFPVHVPSYRCRDCGRCPWLSAPLAQRMRVVRRPACRCGPPVGTQIGWRWAAVAS